MAYKWIIENKLLRRLSDGASIPWPPGESEGRKAQEWMDAGNTPEPADPEPQPDPRRVLDQQEANEAKLDNQVNAFLNMTPAELDAWVDANITGAGPRIAFKVLGKLAQNAARGKALR